MDDKLIDAGEDAFDDVVVDGRRVFSVGEVGHGGDVLAQDGDLAFDGVEDDFLADVRTGERAGDLSGRDPAELELAVEFHGHLLRNRRIDRRAERIVDRREAGRTGAVDDREVLAVRIAVADEKVENDAVDETNDICDGNPQALERTNAIDDRRPALVLVFDFRSALQELAEIFLMKPSG